MLNFGNIQHFQKFFLKLYDNSWDQKFKKSFHEYKFHYFISTNQYNPNDQIIQKIKKSKVIIVDLYTEIVNETEELHFIIAFYKKIIIIPQQSISTFIQWIYSVNTEIEIYFLPKVRNIFDQYNDIVYNYFTNSLNDKYFNEEIELFSQKN